MKMLFQHTTFFCLILSLLVTATPTVWAKSKQEAPVGEKTALDSVVAIVNDDVITERELNHQFKLVKGQLTATNAPLPSDKELRQQVLNHLIDEKVELQTATRAGIEIDDEALNAAISEIAARNKLTTDQFRENFKNENITYNEFREHIRNQIIIERLLQREVGSRINISKQEVDKYYNSVAFERENITEYHLQNILISLPEIPSSEQLSLADKKAKKVMQQLQDGKTFEEIAIANSDGQEALQGGDMGWRRIEEVPTVFADQVQVMESGDVAGPIRASNGYHIIKLLELRGAAARHYRTENDVSHILLKTDILNTDAEISTRIQAIRDEIENGLSFTEAAKKYSEDPVSGANGGKLGWVGPGALVAPFEEAMNTLPIGMISEPIKTQFGWHLILVHERREKEDTEDYQREQIRRMVFERQFQERAQSWVKRMRDASFIQVMS